MIGMSAGAGLSGKYIGLYGHHNLITAYFSVSNPYNFAKCSYHLDNAFWGKILSKLIASEFKSNLKRFKNNPIYHDLLRQRNLAGDVLENDLEKAETCWEVDSIFTHKLGSRDYIIYNNKSERK